MGFIAELRRRNVIRMAGLYLVGAWLLVQIAETLLPIFKTPDWVLQALVVLLALGLVPALVVSWLFELTPDGLKREGEVAAEQSIAPRTARRMDQLTLAGVLLLLAVIAADRYWPRDPAVATAPGAAITSEGSPGAEAPRNTAPATEVNPGSIAVLPFVNMSADKDNEYFSDGISEELLNVLVKVDGLSVASRTSSFAYKGRDQSASSIGAELNVAHVLEGSVRKSGNRVRITAQLIDTGSDRHLWSETYDRELTDIFAIQDEIAKAIVVALDETLGARIPETATLVQADTTNLDAYQLYLKARELFLARRQLDESVRLFEQVVTLDPDFARGWEGLAAASAVIIDWEAVYPGLDNPALMARSEEAADRALALDPALSMPWAARALIVSYRIPHEHARSIELLDRAIAADERNGSAHLWRGIEWLGLGFVDRGLADFEGCLAIDPAYANCLRWKAVALLFKGQVDAALALYETGLYAGFNSNRGNQFVEPLIRRGDRFGALMLMRDIRFPTEIQQAVVSTLADARPPADVAALVARHPDFPNGKFIWGLMLRDYGLAADDAAVSGTLVEFWDPTYEGLRKSPAFKRILENFNVPHYWRAHGFPPQCRPLGEADFECDEGPLGQARTP
jgi:TolB-like protein